MLHKMVLTSQSLDEILNGDSQLKAIEQFFSVELFFFMLYKVVLTSESVDEILNSDNKIKATEQCFPVVLFIILYKVVSTNFRWYCLFYNIFCKFSTLAAFGGS